LNKFICGFQCLVTDQNGQLGHNKRQLSGRCRKQPVVLGATPGVHDWRISDVHVVGEGGHAMVYQFLNKQSSVDQGGWYMDAMVPW
jgi:hypothetical protein